MSEKVVIIVPFLIGYFLMRIIWLIVFFGYDGNPSIDRGYYLFISVACIICGATVVFIYLLLKYFGIT
jgi:hypothetical protein